MNKERPFAILYSTWHYLGRGEKPASYYIVIDITWKEGKVYEYTLYNLCVPLDAIPMKRSTFDELITEDLIRPWKPQIPHSDITK